MSIRTVQRSVLPEEQENTVTHGTTDEQANHTPLQRTRKFTLVPSSSTANIQTTYAMLFSHFGGSFYGTHINGHPEEGTSTNYTFSDKSSFTGKWKRGEPQEGTLNFLDGTFFRGTFENRRPHTGTTYFILSDKSWYQRNWTEGNPTGPAILYDNQGQPIDFFDYETI